MKGSYSSSRMFLAAAVTAIYLRRAVRRFCPTSTEADGSLQTRRRKDGYKMPRFDQEILDDYLDALSSCRALRSTYEQARSSNLEEDGNRLQGAVLECQEMVAALAGKVPDEMMGKLINETPADLTADIFSTPTT